MALFTEDIEFLFLGFINLAMSSSTRVQFT